MTTNDQSKWDRQHADADGAKAPSRFLQKIIDSDHWTIAPGRALDIACGKGRNALFLASRGFQVTAMDISSVGLEQGRKQADESLLSISWQQTDLEQLRLGSAEYDLIININFLQRSLMPQIKAAVKTGGHVIFDTYLIDQQVIGHPKNPDYLLLHNELLDHFRDFGVLFYREGKFVDGAGPSFRAGIFAQRRK
jgi:2-polyprenyl-3-methyl-5-hydroxy-6-metoxy-1,4-benzoquinol methylase